MKILIDAAGKNFAAFEYRDADGNLQVKVMMSEEGRHSERLMADWMNENGVKPEQVTRVYSEL